MRSPYLQRLLGPAANATESAPIGRQLVASCSYLLLVSGAAILTLLLVPFPQPSWTAFVVLFWSACFLPLRDRFLMEFTPYPVASEEWMDRLARRLQTAKNDPERITVFCSVVCDAFQLEETALFFMNDSQQNFTTPRDAFALDLKSTTWTLPTEASFLPKSHPFQSAPLFSASPPQAILPIHIEGNCAAFLLFSQKKRQPALSARDLRQMQSFAHAFESLLSFGIPEWEEIFQLSEALESAADLGTLSEVLATSLASLVPHTRIRVSLLDEHNHLFHNIWHSENGTRRSEYEGVPFPPREDLAGIVLGTRAPFFARSYAGECRTRNLSMREPECAWAAIPLSVGMQTLGVCVLSRISPFSDREQKILTKVSALISPKILRLSLQASRENHLRSLESLHRATRRLSASLDMATVLQAILDGSHDLLRGSLAVVFLPERSGVWEAKRWYPETLSDSGWKLYDSNHPFLRASLSPEPSILASFQEEDPLSELSARAHLTLNPILFLPLRKKERNLGFLVVGAPDLSLPLREDDMHLLSSFAGMAAAALDNSRLYSQTDHSLTALVEEMASLQRLDQELNTALDTDRALSITLDWAMRHSESAAGMAIRAQDGDSFLAAARGYPLQVAPSLRASQPESLLPLLDAAKAEGRVFRRAIDAGSPGLFPSGRAAAVLPVRRGSGCAGWLVLETDIADSFPPSQIDFLERLTAHAAIAIANAELYAEVRNANQAKNEFISFVAHELKTPMTSIRGYTDLLAQGIVGPVNPQQTNFLATIRSNADRLANLVTDLNDISRIESGKMKLEFEHCPLQQALDEVLEGLRSQIDGKEQTLDVEAPQELPPVWVDRGRFIQILTNLVSNAHKYTPAGGHIRVVMECGSNQWDPAGPPEVVHIRVEDNGLGIAPQDQKLIFQKFFRAEDRSVRELPGTGLGLHITRNLIEMMGGRIWFESELHKGTTFHFTVPVVSK